MYFGHILLSTVVSAVATRRQKKNGVAETADVFLFFFQTAPTSLDALVANESKTARWDLSRIVNCFSLLCMDISLKRYIGLRTKKCSKKWKRSADSVFLSFWWEDSFSRHGLHIWYQPNKLNWMIQKRINSLNFAEKSVSYYYKYYSYWFIIIIIMISKWAISPTKHTKQYITETLISQIENKIQKMRNYNLMIEAERNETVENNRHREWRKSAIENREIVSGTFHQWKYQSDTSSLKSGKRPCFGSRV